MLTPTAFGLAPRLPSHHTPRAGARVRRQKGCDVRFLNWSLRIPQRSEPAREFERIVFASFTLKEIRALGWPGESPLVARVREWTR